MKIFISTFLMSLMVTLSFGQVNLTKSRIIADTTVNEDMRAAYYMQRHIKQISGKSVPIISVSKSRKGDIIIGSANAIKNSEITNDGFAVSTLDGRLRILSGEGLGAIYGVCDVLERFFDVKYWSADVVDIPKSIKMVLPEDIDYLSNPAFEYRQCNGSGNENEDYKLFHRLKLPNEIFVKNLWVHTFSRFVSPAEFGKSNPEYFSLLDGGRRPASQLCLTNGDVFDIVVDRLDALFKSDPDKKLISFSQNDANGVYCRCDECMAINNREETPMGSILYFVNKLAKQFPDKEISTLAYQYSVKPPKYMKPLDNVNIMLCNIGCTRELPLVDVESGRVFNGYLQKWNSITDNIYMWDYGINFSCLMSPFPNFHTIQPNIQLFHKSGVTKLFEQFQAFRGVDFSELRLYLAAKLMWNPDRDFDELMKEFLDGYYKDAAPHIYDYIESMQDAILSSDAELKIYSFPIEYKGDFLKRSQISRYNELFNKAEAAVKDDEEVLKRVKLSRLALQYAELEVERVSQKLDKRALSDKLNLFVARAKELKVTRLNEMGFTIDGYYNRFCDRFMPAVAENKAIGGKLKWLNRPEVKSDGNVLVDGLYGGIIYKDGWIGWSSYLGNSVDLVLDLGKNKEVSSICVDFLQQPVYRAFFPERVTIEVSTDGVNYVNYGVVEKEMVVCHQDATLFDKYIVEKELKSVRYIRVKATVLKASPEWSHRNAGANTLVYLDEITVL